MKASERREREVRDAARRGVGRVWGGGLDAMSLAIPPTGITRTGLCVARSRWHTMMTISPSLGPPISVITVDFNCLCICRYLKGKLLIGTFYGTSVAST